MRPSSIEISSKWTIYVGQIAIRCNRYVALETNNQYHPHFYNYTVLSVFRLSFSFCFFFIISLVLSLFFLSFMSLKSTSLTHRECIKYPSRENELFLAILWKKFHSNSKCAHTIRFGSMTKAWQQRQIDYIN